MSRFLRLAALAALTALALPAAHAQSFSFTCITDSNAANCSSGEQQMGLTFSNAGGGQVNFRFTNSGSAALSMTDFYWDWTGSSPSLSTTGAAITSSSGVSVSFGASPANLPGGNPYGFSANLGADSNSGYPGTMANGVNPGEWINFRFNGSFSALSAALSSGALDVGVHVQGFRNGGSESFMVSTAPVPEPGTYALMLAGLGAVGFIARRRRST
jgi:hypothetical protein